MPKLPASIVSLGVIILAVGAGSSPLIAGTIVSAGGKDAKTEVVRYARALPAALQLLDVKLPSTLSIEDIKSLVEHKDRQMRLVIDAEPTVERNNEPVTLRNDRPDTGQYVCRGKITASQLLWPEIDDPDTELAMVYHEILGLCGFPEEEIYSDGFLAALKAYPHLRKMALSGEIGLSPQFHPIQDELVSYMRLSYIAAERLQVKLGPMLSYRTLESVIAYERKVPFVFPFETLEISGQVALAHVRRKQEAIDVNRSAWASLTPEQKLNEALGILTRYVGFDNSPYYVRALAAARSPIPPAVEREAQTSGPVIDREKALCDDFKRSISRDGKPDPFFRALLEEEFTERTRDLDARVPEQNALLHLIADVGILDIIPMMTNWMHLRCLYRPADRFVDVICSSMVEHGQLLLRSSYSHLADPSVHPMLMKVPRTCGSK